MIRFPPRSREELYNRIRIFSHPYLVINLCLAGVVILIFAYSVLFSPDKDNYPVACIHEKITGLPCPSCGLSHSFSLILRGRFDEAAAWNEYGFTVFIFFASQLIMRILYSVIFLKHISIRRQLVVLDITGSVTLFLVTFLHFIIYIFKLI